MKEPVPVTRAWLDEQPPECTFRGCTTPPKMKISPPDGSRPWYGCAKHADRMAEALSVGFGYNQGATVTPLPRRTRS